MHYWVFSMCTSCLQPQAVRHAYLVVHVEALDIAPVALNHINEVIHCAVLLEQELHHRHQTVP